MGPLAKDSLLPSTDALHHTLNYHGSTSTLALPWTHRCDQQLDTFHNYLTTLWFLFLGLHHKWSFPLFVWHNLPMRDSITSVWFLEITCFSLLSNTSTRETQSGWNSGWVWRYTWNASCLIAELWIVLTRFESYSVSFNQIGVGNVKADSKFPPHYTQVLPTLCLLILWK